MPQLDRGGHFGWRPSLEYSTDIYAVLIDGIDEMPATLDVNVVKNLEIPAWLSHYSQSFVIVLSLFFEAISACNGSSTSTRLATLVSRG